MTAAARGGHCQTSMTDTSSQATLERFYRAFAARDGATMSACYEVNATFRDPVFDLHGAEVGAMWRMLCSRGADLRIESENLRSDEEKGGAKWNAWYTFSSTGRLVHNVVQSTFQFSNGKIVDQQDTFSFWNWSRQALGPAGLFLGWSPMLKRKVRATAKAALAHYMTAE